MKITNAWLKEHSACVEGYKWSQTHENRELRREELVKEIVDLPVLGKTKKGGKAIGYYLKAEDILTIADFIVRREQSLQSKLEEAECEASKMRIKLEDAAIYKIAANKWYENTMELNKQTVHLDQKLSEAEANVKMLQERVGELETAIKDEAIKHQWCMVCETTVFELEKIITEAVPPLEKEFNLLKSYFEGQREVVLHKNDIDWKAIDAALAVLKKDK